MIPYLEPLSIGPFNTFGLLVLLGVYAGSVAAHRHGSRAGLDPGQVRRMAMFCGLAGLLGAHVIDVLVYQPDWTIWTLLNPFAGISSMGGVAGGVIGFTLFAHLSKIHPLRYADTAAVGTLVLLVFGRAGCASVHDHVGVATDFALAVDFPRGNPAGVVGPHHDLGLYELAMLLVILGVIALVLRERRRPGLVVGLLAVLYAGPRFLLDFLRRPETDPRTFGLTFAQWATAAMFVAGVVILWSIARRGDPDRYLRGQASADARMSGSRAGGAPTTRITCSPSRCAVTTAPALSR
jgi:phosphatidylglycerol:prolipoprotein diacylglycerol transferase